MAHTRRCPWQNGQGVDRPMLGMRLLAADHGLTHPLFSDPVFLDSKTWRVSTSHLGADCITVRVSTGGVGWGVRG